MLKVGLTGGIGSGKSTVCNAFRELGAPVIDTDELSREVVEPGTPGLSALVSRFGKDILLPDGQLNRSALRNLVFSEPRLREALEAIVHPAIRIRLREELSRHQYPYVIIAIPLLLEKQWLDFVDRVLVVDCNEEQQIERATRRDGSERSLIQKIIASQVSRATRLAAADDIIHNDADLTALRQQVKSLHSYYTKLASYE
jgi:dephospho-CoA kinase